MKIKSKVRGGPRGCGGTLPTAETLTWSGALSLYPLSAADWFGRHLEILMKVKTKVRGGPRGCGGGGGTFPTTDRAVWARVRAFLVLYPLSRPGASAANGDSHEG